MNNWINLIAFKASCELGGIEVPAAIVRGLELVDVAQAAAVRPSARYLDLANDEVAEHITDLSIRGHQGAFQDSLGMAAGIDTFSNDLLTEVYAASIPELDRIVEDLRPRFDELAAHIVEAAVTYGFTQTTTAHEIIMLADEGAAAAWRDVRAARNDMQPIVRIRRAMSEAFKVSPTAEDLHTDPVAIARATSENLDYSICYAADHNWSVDHSFNVRHEAGGQLDWLALAASGGLHLNTPDEVRQKITAKAHARS